MKNILIILSLLLFNGCIQNTAFLGPVYTLGTTGNAIQAGASYGSSHIVRKITTNKFPENVKIIIEPGQTDTGNKLTENVKIITEPGQIDKGNKKKSDDFFRIVKKQIKNSYKALNLEKN